MPMAKKKVVKKSTKAARSSRRPVKRATRPAAKKQTMRIAEAMTTDVRIASPDQTIQDAAKIMAEIDAGSLPVGENDRLVGMITDRDIAIRAVARGLPPDTEVREVMTSEVKYCFEDEDLEHVARNMGEIQVRRLPVLSREKRVWLESFHWATSPRPTIPTPLVKHYPTSRSPVGTIRKAPKRATESAVAARTARR